MLGTILTILITAQLFFDLSYCLRMFLALYFGKWFQKRLNITDTAIYYGICTTRDSDCFLLHMNNARYLRITDAAKFNFWARVGLTDTHPFYKVQMVVGAHTVRYRRPIGLFNPYKIETKLLYWDDKTHTTYLEHRFVTLKDGFVRAVVLTRSHVLGVSSSPLATLLSAGALTNMPEEIRQWENSLKTTSQKIRGKHN